MPIPTIKHFHILTVLVLACRHRQPQVNSCFGQEVTAGQTKNVTRGGGGDRRRLVTVPPVLGHNIRSK